MLDAEQQKVVDAVKSGKNVFFTGPAGTGKSHVIRHIAGNNPSVVLTALTGIAAANIDGKTLHSFAGIGLARESKEELRRMAMKSVMTTERWKRCKTLVVDEVSMMSASLLEKVDYVARGCRNMFDVPFGGIQVVFVGDFKQLPPVSKDEEAEFCFDSPVWTQLKFVSVMLKTNYRQTDPILVKGLAAMRDGVLHDDFLDAISKPKERDGRIKPTKLVSTNRAADQINRDELEALDGEKVTIHAEEREFERGVLDNLRGEKELTLAVGAQVMYLTNNSNGLVNGSRGVVTAFRDGLPMVLFHGFEQPIVVEMHCFEHKHRNRLLGYRKCLPLRLAWALTIHKSQSLTIDLLDVDCDRTFVASQAYVAVSRARTVEGLYVKNLHAGCVWVDERVNAFYENAF